MKTTFLAVIAAAACATTTRQGPAARPASPAAPAFTPADVRFMAGMIHHHQGAITMVNQLFGSQGGGEQETVFRFASDVFADQSTEIDRMNRMLEAFHRSPP